MKEEKNLLQTKEHDKSIKRQCWQQVHLIYVPLAGKALGESKRFDLEFLRNSVDLKIGCVNLGGSWATNKES